MSSHSLDAVNVEDTNMAGIGGNEDLVVRKGAALTEPAWATCGQRDGIEIWRVEDLNIKAWPAEQHGEFHIGDSYIVLETKKNKRGMFEYHVFFWQGNETSVDEQTISAYKTVELCSYFDGRPTQSREVQDHESQQFRSLFPRIKYLAGGIPSGLRHVITDCYEAKLYQVRKTKKGVMEKEVNCDRDSLNDGDCFLLDAGQIIYIFHGQKAHPLEKYEANASASRLESKRKGQSTCTETLDDKFWAHLGGRGPIKAAEEAGDEVKPMERGDGVLYKLTDETGTLQMYEVGRRALRPDMLDSNDVMILDHSDEVCIWVGSKASKVENTSALVTATNFLKTNGRSAKTPIHMFREGQNIKNPLWTKVFAPPAR